MNHDTVLALTDLYSKKAIFSFNGLNHKMFHDKSCFSLPIVKDKIEEFKKELITNNIFFTPRS